MPNTENYHRIPSINVLLQTELGKELVNLYSRTATVNGLRFATEQFRQGLLKNAETETFLTVAKTFLQAKHAPSLKKIINGTGTVIHTNLGRAKLSLVVKDALYNAAFNFTNLEYDINSGQRGSRYTHLENVICELTGAEAALVVNNNAAAVMLVLSALAKDKNVVVSRGELVEIGGSFRIPEIIELSGCKLNDVGTTNKTHLRDYELAIIPEETAAILKVHTSNYKILGFTKSVEIDELSTLANKHQLPLIHDMGSGMLIDLQRYGFPLELTVKQSLAAGADIVTFSGDKVLGGPQAGIIVGKKTYVELMKKNQLTRALRVDKMTMATLEATFRLYLDENKAMAEIPTLRLLLTPRTELNEKAKALYSMLQNLNVLNTIDIVSSTSQVGGGSYPGEEIPSISLAMTAHNMSINEFSERLRKADVPIIGKIRNDRYELDLRTIEVEEFNLIRDTIKSLK